MCDWGPWIPSETSDSPRGSLCPLRVRPTFNSSAPSHARVARWLLLAPPFGHCSLVSRSRSWPLALRRTPPVPCGRFSVSSDSGSSLFAWFPCYAARWYVPTLLKCRRFQQHPWSRVPIVTGRMRRRRRGNCGHGFPLRGQAASSVTAGSNMVSPSFRPSHLWASVTVSLPALHWQSGSLLFCARQLGSVYTFGWLNEHSSNFGGDPHPVHMPHTSP